MKHYTFIKNNNGFTLAELVIAIFVTAILNGALYGFISRANTSQELTYRSEVRRDNLVIARGLRSFAASENNGFLTGGYSGGNYLNAPVDISNSTLTNYLSGGNITSDHYNDDGTASRNVKYLDVLSTQPTYSMPIVGNAAETVTLVYDRAVLIQTRCALEDGICNDGTPAESPPYTQSGWVVGGSDLAPVEISTLDIQQGQWRDTWQRLSRIRNGIRNHFNSTVTANSAGDTTNWFFQPDLAASPDESGANPTTNQGCRNGWYELNDSDINVLTFYGFDPVSIYSQTPWGGRVEYCADYDPHNDGADVIPHISALRLNRAVTTGAAPSVALADNLILVI
jgi:hypothetical protein